MDAAQAQNIPEDRIWAELAHPAVEALLSAGLGGEAAHILVRTSGARGLLERRLEELVAVRGLEDAEVQSLAEGLAHLLGDQGDFAGAQRLQQQVLDVRARLLGEEHPDTLGSMNNLAERLCGRKGTSPALAGSGSECCV